MFEEKNVYKRELNLKIHGMFPLRLTDIKLADQVSYEGRYEELCNRSTFFKGCSLVTTVEVLMPRRKGM